MNDLFNYLNQPSPNWNEIRQMTTALHYYMAVDTLDRYILHYACWKKAPEYYIQELVQKFPTVVTKCDKLGSYPLHFATKFGQSESVIQFLVQQFPFAINAKDNDGYYPLHIACVYNQPESVIQLLIRHAPHVVQIPEQSGRYPLHLACFHDQSESVIRFLITTYPQAVHEKETNGWYPLHCACYVNLSVDIITILLKEHLKAVKEPDADGFYPLHIACERHHSYGVFELFIKYYPKAMQMKNKYSSNPLHQAVSYNKSPSVLRIVQLLTETYPMAVQETEDDGSSVLHLACWGNQPESVIRYILQQYPAAVRAPTTNIRCFPLHRAIEKNQSDAVIELLVNEYTDAVSYKDSDSEYALHLACRYQRSIRVVKFLIEMYPDAIKVKNKDGNYPLHLACYYNASLPVIQCLVQQWWGALQEPNHENDVPLDLAKIPIDNLVPADRTIAWLEQILAEGPPKLRETPKKKVLEPLNQPSKPVTSPVLMEPVEPQVAPTVLVETVDDDEDGFEVHYDKDAEIRDNLAKKKGQVIVNEEYVKSILTEKLLGSGFFGTVYLGFDPVLQQQFAVKTINPEILSAGASSPEIIQKVKDTFHNEQEVLLNFHHPNIARLLAYSFPKGMMGNYYLLYECADRGALDEFWRDDTGREQLSFRRRAIIAWEAMTALRFLHVGNDKFKCCFHRDLKSANIVLKKDLTAQLIDCGLAKFVSDDEGPKSSTGIKGTMGYVCPQYSMGGQPYEAACDIYSFGVVLVELFTGRLQNHEVTPKSYFNFAREYMEKKKPRNLVDDADKIMGFDPSNLPASLQDFAQLALDCMDRYMEDRPSGTEIMDRLKSILKGCDVGNDTNNLASNEPEIILDELICQRCRTYTSLPNDMICHMCFIVDHVQEAKTAWNDIDNKLNRLELKVDTVLVKLDEVLPVLSGLDARFNNPIPRLFILLPGNLKSIWKNPKSWLRSKGVDTYHLHFVCAHTFQAINPPLKIRMTKKWMENVAPVLAVSLYLMSVALKGVNITIDVSDVANNLFNIGRDQICDMLMNAYTILDECKESSLKDSLQGQQWGPQNINVLGEGAYDVVIDEAGKQPQWRNNMVPVKKSSGGAVTLWVAKDIAMNESNQYSVVRI